MNSDKPSGPIALDARTLAPDLARGVMLLFIAIANSHYFLNGESFLGGYPQPVSGLNSIVTWTIATFIDGRSAPLFGLLFGYGVAQIVRRNEGTGRGKVRWMLIRRALALLAVGSIHGLLLYVGDILAAYGVLLLLCVWLVWLRDQWLLLLAAMFLFLISLPSGDSLSINADPPHISMLPPDIWSMIKSRISVQPSIALLGPIGFACPFLIGLLAGRRQMLERPEQYHDLLVVVAFFGIIAGVLGAQPIALVLSGVNPAPNANTLSVFGGLHDSTGILAGIGYAAGITLIASRLENSRGLFTIALAATGQRSLTCYLTQSVVWTISFTPFLFNLSSTLTITTTALLAMATWTLTVVMAATMDRFGHRGPFEVFVRRITYLGLQRDQKTPANALILDDIQTEPSDARQALDRPF